MAGQSLRIKTKKAGRRELEKRGSGQLSAQGVADRARAQQALRESKERIRARIEDISARTRTEAQLARLTRAKRVMAECNHDLIHAVDEAKMLEHMCRIVVESDGYKQAWIGLATGEPKRPLCSVAHSGYGADAPITTSANWGSNGNYRDLASEAFGRGEVRVIRDILNDPQHERKRRRAIQLGYQSCIALPLKANGSVLGVLTLHASEPNAFDADEVALLTEMADDIAFGMAVVRTRLARQQAEHQLRDSERHVREIFDQAAIGIARMDLDGVLVEVNQKFCDMLDYAREELLGKTIREITHADDYGSSPKLRERLARGARVEAKTEEERLQRKDGTPVWVKRTLSAAYDDAGEPKYFVAVIEDITQRKEAAERYRAMFENAAVGITRVDLSGLLLDVNQKFCEMLGYSRDELIGRHVREITHPDDYQQGSQYRTQITGRVAKSATGEKRFVRKDGGIIWARRTMSAACDDAGNPQYIISVVEDISERKQAGLELQRKTELAQLLESLARAANEAASPEAAMRSSLELICEHGRWVLGRLGIYGPGEDERFPERSLWHARDSTRYEPFIRASLDSKYFAPGGRFISVVLQEKRPVWLADIAAATGFGRMTVARECGLASAFAFPVIVSGEVVAFLEFFATEPREPDSLLLEAVASVGAQLARLIERGRAMAAAAQLAAIVESSQDAMVSAALDSTILTWNAGAERLFGYSAAEAIGRNVSIVVPEDRRHEVGPIKAGVLAGQQVGPLDTERLAKDGRRVQVSVSTSPLRDSGNNVTGFALIYRDIADRKRSEEAIARERTLLRTIIDAVPDYIYVKDRDGRFWLANDAWLKARRITREEIVGRTVFDVFPREIAATMAAQDEAIVKTGAPLLDREQKVITRQPDGSESGVRWASTSKVPMVDAVGEIIGTVGVSRDITERVVSGRRREMEHAVTQVLAESTTVGEAMPQVIRVICEAMGWAYGARWACNGPDTGVYRADYWADFEMEFDPADHKQWIQQGAERSRVLLRKALHTKEPTWIADIERHEAFGRRPSALKFGLHSALAFPIVADGNVIGIMEFFGREVRQPDEMMLQITGSLSRQIGQFIQRKEAEQALRSSEESYRDVFEASPLPMWVWDDETLEILEVNEAALNHYGYTRDEFRRMTVRDVWAPGENARYEENIRDRSREQTLHLQRRHRTKDGRTIDVEVTARRFMLSGRSVWLTLVNDVTERKRAEAALRESEEQFRQLANNIPQVFWITDARLKQTLYVSPAAETLIGRPLQEIYANPRILVRELHKDDRARVYAARKAAAAGGYDQTYRIVRPDGSIRWVHDRAFPVHDESGKAYRIAGIAEDVTDRKLAEERLMRLAHYDVLTSLPNRVLFYDRLKQALAQAKRNQWITGVMFIDVDRFKNVNDTLGHVVGDTLLRQISERLIRSVRSGDTVGRLGGDEFAIVLSDLASVQDANLVAQKIMASFKEPFKLESAELYVTASIGITLYPDDSTDQDTLIKNADTAMYRAKEVGRNSYQFYTPEMNARALEVLSMESSMRRALDRSEFLLYYQPKANIGDGDIVGVEALLRWHHPERGLVSPGEFIPVLEETGLIVPVGEWVLNAVCQQIKAWGRAGITSVPVAVNLSARQFSARDLGQTIKRIIEEHQVDPALIELEITESSLMANTEEAVNTLEYLENLGVGLSIDDFGTGYSSLGYIKRFPLAALKIDRSFVRDITTDGDDATITRAVISMAHSLGLKVIAEGVETEAQLAFLAENGCDEIQGYFFSRPMPAEECGAWLRDRRRLQRRSGAVDAGAPVVLLVDDDDNALRLLERALSGDGYRILMARNPREAIEVLRRHPVALVITDQRMPGMSGAELLRHVQAAHPQTMRMMTSVHTDLKTAADAVGTGEVFRFLPKQCAPDQLRADVREALRARASALARTGHYIVPGTVDR